ncbi:uncharacterized protein At2g33490-like isoform X2 [Argentina anserina]|uniref:uncharacterized protein At2g33490-like isoform X2 n=1 Tax=Argentina anserina TaxID=57926 RepID=UPI0021764379|nr:uncharacterized protein At2g33490-like isoform X2 [Potentilla anserina]
MIAYFPQQLLLPTAPTEKTALHDDEHGGRVFLMLGKVQFELQKLVDSYRSHIVSTVTNPSESLLNELRTVEEMKRQCDEKREVYEYMLAQQKEKGRSKRGKGESFTMQQLQVARDQYDEDATLCVFRLKSLKQGQARSLLTQAARHHAAQLNFFRKGLKSLEAVEPHVRLVTEEQHIEYQFSGLEDDGEDNGADHGENSYDSIEDGELSFDLRSSKQGMEVSAARSSMEIDEMGHLSPQPPRADYSDISLDQGDFKFSSREPRRGGSYSAPIVSAEPKFDPAERARQLQLSATRKPHTYVLPTPDSKGLIYSKTSTVPDVRSGGRNHNLSHSSPLDAKHDKYFGDDNLTGANFSKAQSVVKESHSANTSMQLPPPPPPPLADGLALHQHRRQASGPIVSSEAPQLVSGMFPRLPNPQPSSSPKISPSASPPLASSPKISELHELPRPPGSSVVKPTKSFGLVGHSAPLVLRNQEPHSQSKKPSVPTNLASPLPIPPLIIPRSFSIPSSSQRTMSLHVSRHLESPLGSSKPEEVASPPLTPISLTNV